MKNEDDEWQNSNVEIIVEDVIKERIEQKKIEVPIACKI